MTGNEWFNEPITIPNQYVNFSKVTCKFKILKITREVPKIYRKALKAKSRTSRMIVNGSFVF